MTPMMKLMTDDEVATFGTLPDSSFGALQTAQGNLPLTAMQIDARVRGVMAAVEVAQTFVNTLSTAIEATYIFPMPDRMAVHRFRMEVAGKVIDGVIDERGAAREQYDQAIAAGHRAAITEKERDGLFTLRVGNLMPGEVAVIRLTVVGPLPVDDGEITFQFPLVVAPRYIPGTKLGGEQAGLGAAPDTDLVPDASRISPPVRLPGLPNPVKLSLRVAIHDPHLKDLASSLHGMTTSVSDAQVVEIQPGERLDRDFILRWRLDGEALASSLVCSDDADGKAGTFMLTMMPPSMTTVASKPRDVVFVLDRSGSMDGWKMVAARRAVGRMIDSLTSRDRFCALAFDTSVEAIPRAQLVAATDRERFRAVEQLSKVDARGGTEMLEPLQQALALTRDGYADRERVVVLVTDGQVGNEDQLLQSLGDMRNTKMFTLGIDQAVNAGFLRRLASAGGGLCELVESEDRLDAVMAKVHRRIGTPIATELTLVAADVSDLAPMTTPGKLPEVYAGAPVVIFGRYRGAQPRSMELVGSSYGDPFKAIVERTSTTGTDLAASWARARIRDLEDRYNAGAKEVLPEIVTLSKQYMVLSRFTAFIAIDRSEVANKDGRLMQVVQAVEAPAGWEERAGGRSRGPGGQHANAPVMRSAAAPMAKAAHSLPYGGPAIPGAGAPAMPPSVGAPPAMPMGAARLPFGAPPAMPSTPPAMPSPQMPPSPARVASIQSKPQPPTNDASAYLVSLAELARALAAAQPAALRLIRQRLTQWVEDVRSTGVNTELANAVFDVVTKLSAAIANGNDVKPLADELLTLSAKPAGRAFWK